MKRDRRWLKSAIAASLTSAPLLPWQRTLPMAAKPTRIVTSGVRACR